MQAGLLGFLGTGLGLGMVHALDADHILAVSTLAVHERSGRIAWRFCARWALGHGGALLTVGALVLVAGFAIPAAAPAYAERAVGLVMVALGTWVALDLRRRDLHLHVHRHAGLPAHAHWHAHPGGDRGDHRHGHGATLVGALHGLAGSAPALLLLPLTQGDAAWHGLLYLATFSVGVLLAMLAFGGALGGFLRWRNGRAEVWTTRLRLAVAAGAVLVGARLLGGAV